VDRAVAYNALGRLDLTPDERDRAAPVIARALLPHGITFDWFRANLRSVGVAVIIAMVTLPFWAGEVTTSYLYIAWYSWHWLAYLMAFWPPLVLVALLTPLLTAIQFRVTTRQERVVQDSAMSIAVTMGGPRCLEPLYQHVWRKTRISFDALITLATILPNVDESWYGCLPRGTSRAMASLAGSPREDLALSALDALGRAGDGSTAAAVERIVQRTKSKPVQQRAIQILPILTARRATEATSSTLLRPSAATPVDNLLRPTGEVADGGSSLLRATLGNTDAT
jgi:hypothetical protein